jgi:zinc transporter 1/2/3
LKSKKITENKLTLSLANAFSGGVFLSLAFGHLIPECVSGFQNFYAQSSTTSSSLTHAILQNEALPYMLVLGGYLLIFFVEKIAFDAHGALHELEHAKDKMTPSSSSSSTTIMDTHTSSLHHSNHEPPSISTSSSSKVGMPVGRSALILLAALAVHSVLEMTALGLADSFGDCSLLSLSIALHQV